MLTQKTEVQEFASDVSQTRTGFVLPGDSLLILSVEQYALTEASYATIRLMQEFKSIESRDPEPWKELLTITCASLNGTQVALTPF